MSKYTLEGRKSVLGGSTWLRSFVLLSILAMGLLVYDVAQFHSLMLYTFTGIK